MGPPSFLSLSINNRTGKYLWVALIDKEKVFRKRKESWGEKGGKQGMKGQSAPRNCIQLSSRSRPPKFNWKKAFLDYFDL